MRELDTNIITRAYFPFKMADRRGEKRYLSCLTQAKLMARYKKVVSTVFFFNSLSLYGITIIPFLFNNLISFQKDFSQKTVRLGALS